jgi:hypothetical protein
VQTAVFWQKERLLGLFSTGTEKDDFTGFSGFARIREGKKGARIGFFPLDLDTCFLGH